MGRPAISDQRSAISRHRVEVSLGAAEWATGDGRRASNPSELEVGSWELGASPGRLLGLIGPAGSGLTSLGIFLIASATAKDPVAVLDVRGWFCPSVAWEAGIAPERLVVVRCADPEVWPRLMATLLEGFPAVYAEVPRRVPDQVLRRLGALARSRHTAAVLRAMDCDLPTGFLHMRMEGVTVRWEGVEAGHGRLQRRALSIAATGKGVGGIERILEIVEEDDGAHSLRLVSRLAAAPAGRATG